MLPESRNIKICCVCSDKRSRYIIPHLNKLEYEIQKPPKIEMLRSDDFKHEMTQSFNMLNEQLFFLYGI